MRHKAIKDLSMKELDREIKREANLNKKVDVRHVVYIVLFVLVSGIIASVLYFQTDLFGGNLVGAAKEPVEQDILADGSADVADATADDAQSSLVVRVNDEQGEEIKREQFVENEDGTYDIDVEGVFIEGLRPPFDRISFKKGFSDDEEVKTQVVTVPEVELDFRQATISLDIESGEKENVDVLLECLSLDIVDGKFGCADGWISTEIPFVIEEDTIIFTTTRLSTYAGGENTE